MARTAAEHVVFLVVDSPVPHTDEGTAIGNNAAKAYVPVTVVDGKTMGLAENRNRAGDGNVYRVGSFSTPALRDEPTTKTVTVHELVDV